MEISQYSCGIYFGELCELVLLTKSLFKQPTHKCLISVSCWRSLFVELERKSLFSTYKSFGIRPVKINLVLSDALMAKSLLTVEKSLSHSHCLKLIEHYQSKLQRNYPEKTFCSTYIETEFDKQVVTFSLDKETVDKLKAVATRLGGRCVSLEPQSICEAKSRGRTFKFDKETQLTATQVLAYQAALRGF